MALGGLWSRVTGAIAGLAIGRTAGDATRPLFELVRQEAWDANPNAIVGPQVLASLVATGVLDFDPAAAQAKREGLNANQFAALVQYYVNAPQLGMALQALQRGKISEAQYRTALAKQGIAADYHDAMVDLRHSLVPQSDLVRMAVREVFSPAQREFLSLDAEYPDAFTTEAAKLGLSQSIARDYWAAHWELPSYTQLTEMRFRGLLTDAQFANALRAIDIAPFWRDKMLAIARRIPTPTDYARLAVREVYNPAQRQALDLDAEFPPAFADKMALHGMSEQDSRDLWAGHWRLPSARQGYTMLWRDHITDQELAGLLKALDYAPVWRDKLAAISHIEPGRIDLKRFLRHGILDRNEVKQGYIRIGYTPEKAEWMVQVAEAEVGAGASESSWVGRARSRLYTVTHDEFLDGSLTEQEARQMLGRVGATQNEAAQIVGFWKDEQAIARLELTPAQIRKAYKKALYDRATAISELEERGMTAEDAATFLESG